MLVSNDGIGQDLDLMHTERNGYGKFMFILGPSVVYILYVIERESEPHPSPHWFSDPRQMRPITRNGWFFHPRMEDYYWVYHDAIHLTRAVAGVFFDGICFSDVKIGLCTVYALYTYYCVFSQVTIPGIINYTPTRYLPIFFTAHLRGQTPKWWNFLGRGWEATGRRMPGACRDANAGSLH